MPPPKPKPVAIIMGSQSDWAVMRHCAETLGALGIAHESLIVSAHRTPERLYEFAKGAKAKGYAVVIAGAGGAAHLPGMTAAMTPLPVFGVPIPGAALGGCDSLYSIVQMPGGVPVGTLAIGKPGAINAALLAAAVLASARRGAGGAPRRVAGRKARCGRARARRRSVAMILAPGATIGILGGGQLGRMLALAAARLGLRTHIYCPDPDSPAFEVSSDHTVAPYEDEAALRVFAACGRGGHLRIRERAGAHGGGAGRGPPRAARRGGAGGEPGPARREAVPGLARHRHGAVRRGRHGRRPAARGGPARAPVDPEDAAFRL